MRLLHISLFVGGLFLGSGITYFAVGSFNEDRLARERLRAYRIFMTFYSERDQCLRLPETAHRGNEALLVNLKLVGPSEVGGLAEDLYLTCSEARDDARNANVPVDWRSRRDHSWTKFDQTRLQLVARMVRGLPDRYHTDFASSGAGLGVEAKAPEERDNEARGTSRRR